jgi:hypothetical protein
VVTRLCLVLLPHRGIKVNSPARNGCALARVLQPLHCWGERDREREGRRGRRGGPAMGHYCCSKQKVKRGLWSPEEDEKLLRYITAHGHSCWSSVPKHAGTVTESIHRFFHPPLIKSKSFCSCLFPYPGHGVCACRASAVRQELPAPVDQLPPAGPEARHLLGAGGAHHHRRPPHPRKPVTCSCLPSALPASCGA